MDFLLKHGKKIRDEMSSNFRTAAGRGHRENEVSDEEKHLRTSHYFEYMFLKAPNYFITVFVALIK